MAITIANATTHARAVLKLPASYASAEELRIANTVNTLIVSYTNWHWNIAAATNIAVSSGTQDYSMAAGDQNRVMGIHDANLLEGSTEQPSLLAFSRPVLQRSSTTGQPYAVCLLSVTQLRLFPVPDASYTLQWRYYDRPTVFAANTESWDVPEALADVAKTGMVWQLLLYGDDDRSERYEKIFFSMLENHKRIEERTMNRSVI